MKDLIIAYSNAFPNHKVIQDKNVISFLDSILLEIIDENKNRERKIKATLYLLDLSEPPKCYCGNDLEFIKPHSASPIYKSPFGGWREFCSKKCSLSSESNVEKRKQTNTERYGASSWAKSEAAEGKLGKGETWSNEKKQSFNKKSKKTNLEKRGVEHHSQTQEYLDKRTETCLERYGVENVFQSEEIKDKSKETMLEKYGYETWFQSEEGRRYVSENNPNKDPEVKLKSRITYYNNMDHVNLGLRNALIINDPNEFKRILLETAEKVGDHRKDIAKYLGILHRRLDTYMLKFGFNDMFLSKGKNKSYCEIEIYDFIKAITPDIILKDRKTLYPKELDMTVPSKGFSVEYNGMYYHSEFNGGKDYSYHLFKTNECENRNLQLFHIMESEWENETQQEIWKSILMKKLDVVENKINADDCFITELTKSQAEGFFEENDLIGYKPRALIKLGLVYNDEIVSAILVGKRKFDTTDNLEVFGFCDKINTTVHGSLEKLLESIGTDKIVAYADRRIYSTLGNVYSDLFEEETITEPSWYGFTIKNYIPLHKSNFTKPKMKALIDNYDDGKTLIENMNANGYDRMFDSGCIKYSKLKI